LEFIVDQRLGEKIERSHANRFDRRLDRAVAGNHDDRRCRPSLPAIGEQVESVIVAQADVKNRHIVCLTVNPLLPFKKAHRGIDLVSLRSKPVGHRAENLAVVVD
jgi:hypothetical protein